MASGSKIAETLISWGLGALFLYAGTVKLLRPDEFQVDILSFHLVGFGSAYWIAIFLPALEVVAGAGIFLRGLRRESALILAVMSFVFAALLVSAWIRGIDVSCGCFGRAEAEINYPLVLGRNLLLVVAGVLVFWFHSRPHK